MPPARLVFYAATLGGILFTLRTLLIAPPPLWAAVLAAAGYSTVVTGVFVLRLRMFVDAIVHGPDEARGVVLTFDDGPDPVHTREVLDILDQHEAKATFFVIGRKVEKHPEVVAEIARRGHDVGVHGFAHDRLFSLRGARRVRRDLERAIAVIERATKVRPRLFRPPIGHTNPTIARIAEQLDLTVVGWSVAGYDGVARARPTRVASRVSRDLDDGAIVLLHDAAENDDHAPAGVAALREILASAKDKNLRVARLGEWLQSEDA